MPLAKKLKSFERDNKMFVKGTTTINHLIRVRNDLTITQYVLLDFFMQYNESSNNAEPITFGRIWVGTGLKPTVSQRTILFLKSRGFLYKDKNKILVLDSYKKQFQETGSFDEFWKISPKGTKTAAMRAYEKLIRKYPHEKICEKYKDYLEFCDKSGRFKLDTSTWLHPKNGYMETEWIEELKPEKKTEVPENTLNYNFLNGKS